MYLVSYMVKCYFHKLNILYISIGCSDTELKPEDIIMAIEANSEVDSIFRTVYRSEGKDVYMVDQIVRNGNGVASYSAPNNIRNGDAFNGNSISVDEEKEKLFNHILLEDVIKKLGDVEKKLINYRYYQDMTQTQIAEKMGISQVQVSRLEKRILKKMRAEI